jgi:hypothetical protein
MNEATEGRDDAMALFEEYRAEWLAMARYAAIRLYYTLDRPITVDDVRAECPPPRCFDPRVMGAVFAGWTPVGFANSRRRTCHGRPIRLFEPTVTGGNDP